MVGLETEHGEGGIQRYNRRLLTTLYQLQTEQAIGESVFVSLWDEPRRHVPMADRISRDPDTTEMVRHRQLGLAPAGNAFSKAIGSLRSMMIVAWIALRLRPQVCIATHIVAAVPLAPIKLLRPSTKIIVVVHGVEVWRPLAVPFRLALRYVDHLAPVSNYTEERMRRENRWLRCASTIVPCAADASNRRRERNEIAGQMLTVARLNHLDRDKNVDRLIDAMPAIVAAIPDARLMVVGDGDMRDDLVEQAARLGVDDAITFHGRTDDAQLDALYASSQVFVLPSTREGFGIVYLEAWLAGLPVIAGNAGAAPEVVRDGIDGLCVEPTPEAISEAVIALLSDTSRREQMANSGIERVSSSFTHAKFVERWSKVITTIAGATH